MEGICDEEKRWKTGRHRQCTGGGADLRLGEGELFLSPDRDHDGGRHSRPRSGELRKYIPVF